MTNTANTTNTTSEAAPTVPIVPITTVPPASPVLPVSPITTSNTLRKLGLTRCYKGLTMAVYAIDLALEDDFRLLSVTRDIYKVTADHFHCRWTRVERNLRTTVARAWQVNPELLCQMAGYPLDAAPTASEFIEIVSSYIIRSSLPQD